MAAETYSMTENQRPPYRLAGKWNRGLDDYEPVILPADCSTYEDDMETIVRCAQCGKPMKFGSGYASKEVHTAMGMGYCVCPDCYAEEWERESAFRKKRGY